MIRVKKKCNGAGLGKPKVMHQSYNRIFLLGNKIQWDLGKPQKKFGLFLVAENGFWQKKMLD